MIPKDDGALTDRRYAARGPAQSLPAAGYRGDYPPPPATLPATLHDDYATLWRSPMAAAWLDEDAALAAELVALRHLIADTIAAGKHPPGTSMARVGVVEDRLGMSPRARAQLRWRVDAGDAFNDDDYDAGGDVGHIAGSWAARIAAEAGER